MEKKLITTFFFSRWEETRKLLLIMKISCLITFVCVLHVSATTYSQNTRLNLNLTNKTVREVLKAIEAKSEFRFFYNDDFTSLNKTVSVVADKRNIDDILKDIFSDANVTYKIMSNNVVVILPTSEMQQLTVTGTVIDGSANEPLIGVSIGVEGSTTGTITDVNGHFSIDVPAPNSVLVFSFIGYNTERITWDGKATSLEIKMIPDVTKLDEVVVVGYGTQKKSDITGSVTSVPKDRLSKLPVNNVLQAIQGVSAGVNVNQASSIPGDAPSVLVRGANSISSSKDPYIVVDGIPLSKTDGSINDINPNDIESVEILKDASAVAIYGVNGANGVILITTKRGAKGKPVVRYSGYTGVEEMAHVLEPGSAEQVLARYAEYSRIQKSSLYNGGPVRYQFEADNYANGKTTNWIDEVSQTGIVQDHNVAVTGGSDNVSYYISGDYMDQKGVIKGYNYKRYSFRTNADINVTKYLTIGTSSFIVAHNRDGGRANLLNATAMSPYAKMYNDDGTYTQYPMYSETLWANPLLNTTLNPERRQFNISVNGYAEMDFGKIWKPLSGLRYKFNGGYTYVPYRTNEYEGKSVYNMTGHGKIVNRESQTYTLENIISYSKDLGKHHFDLTGLYASKSKYYQEAVSEGNIFPNDDLSWAKLGAASTQIATSYADLYRTLSQMGRLNYSYASRYLLTVTARRDGSSVFVPKHKYGVFPSVAVGWNIANESFMSSLNKVINNFKLRVSYGKSGNEAIGVYQSLFKMDANTLTMGGQTQTTLKVATRMGNSDLTWETTKGFNSGIDFGFFNNRINGTVDYYQTQTSGILLIRSLPQITGYTDVYDNIGKTKNRGIEVTVNSKNIASRNFTWASTIVFARNNNELVDLYGDGKDDLGQRWFLNHPVGVIYDYTKVGIWQEDDITNGLNTNWDPTALAGDLKLADISGPNGTPDGRIDDYDRTILGQTDPKWTGGITNTFTYRNLTLSIFINTVQGALRNNAELSMASDEMGRRNGPADIGYWTPDNKSNEWRSLGNHSNSHGYGFPSDASYTRIKDITLSYNMPKSVLGKIGINGLQVYVSGRNLYTFTNWIGWDPEARDIGRGSTNWDINYPVVRSYIFGLNLTL